MKFGIGFVTGAILSGLVFLLLSFRCIDSGWNVANVDTVAADRLNQVVAIGELRTAVVGFNSLIGPAESLLFAIGQIRDGEVAVGCDRVQGVVDDLFRLILQYYSLSVDAEADLGLSESDLASLYDREFHFEDEDEEEWFEQRYKFIHRFIQKHNLDAGIEDAKDLERKIETRDR